MKKVLALILAVTMLLTLNVGALAADTVEAVDSGITLSHTTVNILLGKSFVLVPTRTPNTGWAITWTSSDTGIVTVDDHGVITAVGAGKATVTAAASDNAAVFASCEVNVVEESRDVPVQAVELPFHATVRVGQSKTLTAAITPENATNKKLIWTTPRDNPGCLTVDENGVITGIAPTRVGMEEMGDVIVRATSEDGNHWAECEVTVLEEDAPAIYVDRNYGPGQTVKRSISINNENQSHGMAYISDCEVTALSFRKGLLKGRADEGIIRISPAVPHHAAGDAGKTIEDTMTLTLSDGSTHEFPVELTFTADIVEKVHDAEDGTPLSQLPMGKSYRFPVEVIDIANIGVRPYHVSAKVTMGRSVADVGVENAALDAGENTAYLRITPLKLGSAELMICISDAAENGQLREVFYPIDVIPEDTTPILTPGSFETSKESASDNEANSSDTLAGLANANNALTTGGTLPEEVVDAVTASGTSVPAIPVKLYSGSANLFVDTADLIGTGRVGLLANVNRGSMTVLIPGGFGKVTEPGRIYYPLDFERDPRYAGEMLAAVKGEGARSEAVKAGGATAMPTTVTVTLRTNLTGTVRVYLYDEETGSFTLTASPVEKDGRITFATRRMGYFLLTTGRV